MKNFARAYRNTDYHSLSARAEFSIHDLANRVGKPPAEIEKEAYGLARKYGYAVTRDMTIITKKIEDIL